MNKLDLAMKKVMRLVDIEKASDRRDQIREIMQLLDDIKTERKKRADEVTQRILDETLV